MRAQHLAIHQCHLPRLAPELSRLTGLRALLLDSNVHPPADEALGEVGGARACGRRLYNLPCVFVHQAGVTFRAALSAPKPPCGMQPHATTRALCCACRRCWSR